MILNSKRIPAEWERHDATLLSYPADDKDWPGKYYVLTWTFIEIIRKLVKYEPVILLVRNTKLMDDVKEMLTRAHVDHSRVRFIIKPVNRNWMRDSGPVIITGEDGKRQALHFNFNAWAKYPDYRLDQGIPEKVASSLDIPLIPVMYNGRHVVLEGGSIDHNGNGTLITTEECLLHDSIQVRNQGFTKKDYENIFREYMGVTNVIWLGEGIEGDDTHGHVDDICRFVNRNTLVTVRESNPHDNNYRKLEENFERLQDVRLENGEKPEIISVPMPDRIDFGGIRLPASYVNFIIAGKAVFLPVFNDKNDYHAIGIFKELFPDYDVMGICAVDLVWGLGTLHCLSREIPARTSI